MKEVLCDTSVLVAALLQNHPDHEPSFRLFQEIKKGRVQAAVAVHSLAECYAVLTSLPHPTALPSVEVGRLMREVIWKLFDVTDLQGKDYRALIDKVASDGFRGGAVYDALIAQVAIRRKIPTIVTWNLKDFTRFKFLEIRVMSPEQFTAP